MPIPDNTPWSQQHQHAAGHALLRVLAGTFVLTLKFRELVWMSTDKLPAESTHIFISQYRYLDRSIDDLAERVASLVQEPVRFDLTQLQAMSAIDDDIDRLTAAELIDEISNDHLLLVADIDTVRAMIPIPSQADKTQALLKRLARRYQIYATELKAVPAQSMLY